MKTTTKKKKATIKKTGKSNRKLIAHEITTVENPHLFYTTLWSK